MLRASELSKMPIFPIATLLFIVIPLIELYLIIKVGGLIGAFPTVVLVILTAVIGVNLLRMQGFSTMAKFQQELATGQMPAVTMMEGAALLFGGALLLTPGFLTDTIGFLCLIPFTRRTFIYWLMRRIPMKTIFSAQQYPPRQPSDNVIEGEYEPRDKNR